MSSDELIKEAAGIKQETWAGQLTSKAVRNAVRPSDVAKKNKQPTLPHSESEEGEEEEAPQLKGLDALHYGPPRFECIKIMSGMLETFPKEYTDKLRGFKES